MTKSDTNTEGTPNQLKLDAQYEVVVIGGGAAGLSGALALARSRRSVLVVDAGQPRNAPAAHMHNYLSRDGTPPQEFVAIGRTEVLRYGGAIVAGTVTAVKQDTSQADRIGFRVTLADGSHVGARRLLVATGLRDELPELPGVAERWGRDVVHCPYCHGWEVRDQAIGVLVTSPAAVHQALLFRQLSADVVVFQHTGPALSDEQVEQLTARDIAIIEGEVSGLEVHDDRLVGVSLRSGTVVARQAIVVAPRFTARTQLLESLGLDTSTTEIGGQVVATYIAADATGATNVPGVWVAGNVTAPTAQVVTSAAAGLMAGAVINANLIEEETEHAVATLRDNRPVEPAVSID